MPLPKNNPDKTALREHWEKQQMDAARAASPLQEKVLLFMLMDAMARARFSREKERERAIRFFETCSRWDGRWKVSLPQLKYHLEAMFSDAERRKSRLWAEVDHRLARAGGRTGPEHDPGLSELEPFATLDECGMLERTKYSSLFEAYRRETLEGFREPESAAGARPEMSQPYYRKTGEGQHLVFPVEFLRELCRDGILELCGGPA